MTSIAVVMAMLMKGVRYFLFALVAMCWARTAVAQSEKKSDNQSSSLIIFPDDYDDDSTLSTPASYNDRGPGCSFGLEMGVNVANYFFSQDNNTYKNSFVISGRIGGVFDIALSRHLYLEPGAFYAVNGTTMTPNEGIPENIYLYTAEVPISVLYKLGNARGNRFFFGAGIFGGYNFGGTDNYTPTANYPSNIKIGTDKNRDMFAPLDYGVGINAGYQQKDGLYYRVRYQVGLANLSPDTDNNRFIRSSSFGAQIGYFFRHAKNNRRSTM